MTIDQTAAGQEVMKTMLEERRQLEYKLGEMKEEYEEALKLGDEDHARMLYKARKRLQNELDKLN